MCGYVSVGRPFPGPAQSEGWIRWLETAVEDEVDRILEHVALHGEDAPERWTAAQPAQPAPAAPVGPGRSTPGPFASNHPGSLTPSASGH